MMFRVKLIRVEGTLKDVTLFGLEDLKDKRIVFLSTKKTEEQIKQINPFLSSVVIKKRYPSTLDITIEQAAPYIYLKADPGLLVLNLDGRIMQKIKDIKGNPILPYLTYFQKFNYASYQPGDIIDLREIKMALIFVKKVTDAGLKVNTIDIDGVGVIGLHLKGKTILFSSEKDVESQVYQMEQIVHQFKIQGKDFKKLDLRFNRPVLELIE